MAPRRKVAKPAVNLEITVDGQPVSLNGSGESSVQEVAPGVYSILHEGKSYEVRIADKGSEFRALVDQFELPVEILDSRNATKRTAASLAHQHQDVKAPMPGKIIRTLVSEGDQVQSGQGLVVVEAMKMQNELKALRAGRVLRVAVSDGDTVGAGDVLVTLE
jgi:biotin carboxyl carrier protein